MLRFHLAKAEKKKVDQRVFFFSFKRMFIKTRKKSMYKSFLQACIPTFQKYSNLNDLQLKKEKGHQMDPSRFFFFLTTY